MLVLGWERENELLERVEWRIGENWQSCKRENEETTVFPFYLDGTLPILFWQGKVNKKGGERGERGYLAISFLT